MTSREYLKRMCDAAAAEDGKKSSETIKEYVGFALGEILKVCNGNVSNETMFMWAYALRRIADVFDAYTSEDEKALMECFDKYNKLNIIITTMPDLEGMSDARE